MPDTLLVVPKLQADIRLLGAVSEKMVQDFRTQLLAAPVDGPLVVEVTTTGGDADIGRRLALDVRLLRRAGREVFFLGKSMVYSAGVTIMAAFPVTHRFLTEDCVLLVHERRMDKELKLTGALRACRAQVRDVLAEIDNGEELEREGFKELIQGSDLSFDELMEHVNAANWYIKANDARDLGLVAGLV